MYHQTNDWRWNEWKQLANKVRDAKTEYSYHDALTGLIEWVRTLEPRADK